MQMTARRSLDTLTWLVEHDPIPLVSWHDSDVDDSGFDARSVYVETYWLSVLGPSCVFAARRLTVWLEVEPSGFELSLVALAESLGLGTGIGRHSPIVRTMARLADFGLASITDTYGMRHRFPPLSARQIARLPDHLAAAHATERVAAVLPC
jgi:hypothetical protein